MLVSNQDFHKGQNNQNLCDLESFHFEFLDTDNTVLLNSWINPFAVGRFERENIMQNGDSIKTSNTAAELP